MIELPDDVYSGMRVLFKNGHGWEEGELRAADLNTEGLSFSVIDINGHEITGIDGSNIFFNARALDDWEYSYVVTKDEFLELVENEEVNPASHGAWMSDGEYAYYSVAKWTKNWLQKQPLEYVLCE